MKDVKMIDTAFKNFCDAMTTMLYKERQHNFQHNCKAKLLMIIIDSGIPRRIEAYTHQSSFEDDNKDVDISFNSINSFIH